MDKRLRKYYFAAVLNFFLWLPLLSIVVFPSRFTDSLSHDYQVGLVIAGVILAALLQHWTYYDIYHVMTRLTSEPACPPGA